jgi:hypothetical protein
MKRQTLTLRLRKQGASAIAGLAIVCGTTPGYAGWNPFSPGSPIEVGPQSGQIAIADFNGDGHGDILASHPLHGRASLLFGDGHGEFPMTGRATIAFGYDPSALAVGDVNGDKRPDLAVASREGSTASTHILLGSADGGFQEIKDSGLNASQITATGWKPSLAIVDVNGDEKLDLVSADGRTNVVGVFYGTGAGQFVSGQTVTLAEGFDNYTRILGDVNDDGRLDLIVAGAMAEGDEPGRLTVFFGNDQGELVEAPELSADIPAGAQVKTVCDIDGDKRSDVVLTHQESMTALVKNEEGKLVPSAGSPFDMGHEAFAVAAVPAGFAGNDVLAVATVDSLDVIFVDEGEFRRACNSPIHAGPGAYNVATGDLNGDGQADVVANSFEGNALSLLLSN